MISPTLSVLYSECILSLYPILIKTVPTNLVTQWLARFLVFPTLSFLLGPTKDITSIWTDPYESSVAALNGVLNLIHVGVSFLSYQLLPAGTALSLFYLYPIFNVIAGSLLFGESISYLTIFLLAIALLGVYLISSSTPNIHTNESDKQSTLKDNKSHHWGIIMGLMAAITETIIYLFVRWNRIARTSPWYTVNHIYPFGLLLLLMYAFSKPTSIDMNPKNWLILLLFNGFLGFSGYFARFFAIPKLPTLIFSLLSFFGVTFGYLWGKWFANEQPTSISLLGSGLIVLSAFLVRMNTM